MRTVEEWKGWIVTLGAAVWVASPVVGNARDSYPISTYPMFAARRGQPVIEQLREVMRDGRTQPIAAEWFGTTELLQAKAIVQRAVRGGKPERRKLCKKVAERLAAAGRDAVEVEWVKVRYDAVAFLVHQAPPTSERIVLRCAVPSPERK